MTSLRRTLFLSAALTVLPAAASWSQTLQDALAAAYANNPTLLAARAQARAVDENVPQALAGWRPTVVLGAAGGYADTRYRSQSTVAVQRDPSGNVVNLDSAGTPYSIFSDQPRDTANVTATVTQPLYRGGRTTAGTRRAENQVYGQRARLLATEQTVLLDGVRAYVSVVQNREEVRLNENNVQVLLRQLQATNERFRVGEITRTDVAQAEARLAAARFQLEQAQGTLQASRATFVRVIGLEPLQVVPPSPVQPPVRNLQEAIRLATGNSPAVVAATFDEQAARDNIDLQFGALLPTVSAQVQAFRLDNSQTRGTRQTGAQVTANLSVPLYQGGAEHSAVRQARQQAQQARQVLSDAKRVAEQDATRTWEALTTARAQVQSSQAEIRAQEIALDGVQREAIVGSRTTLDVLNAEQELLNARVRLVRALATLITSSYELTASLGRLTAQDLALPVLIYDPRSYYNAVRDRWVGTGDFNEQVPQAAVVPQAVVQPQVGSISVQPLVPINPNPPAVQPARGTR
ncbi:TolC family outer membrane protein [Roseomonas sp. HJA6]|uniref:TolC family outer membrane protein n=1 Tax=Roseomonas alba TaxID=2846776 RepID=A0ABS7ABX4_9PROT|nr:TolC family outer membrane protein [Neoroseomonas alba]MBW6399793.1 TolC family outer membrane protein [Neoroseomonas alba]